MEYDHYTIEECPNERNGYSNYGSHPVKIITWEFPESEYDFKCTRCGTQYRVGQRYVRHQTWGLEYTPYHHCPRCGHDNKGFIHGLSKYVPSYGDD